jgi:hypothetical protein
VDTSRASSRPTRIDWIGVSRDWKVVAAGIDRTAILRR